MRDLPHTIAVDKAMVVCAQHAQIARVVINHAGNRLDVMDLDDRFPGRRAAPCRGEVLTRRAAINLA